MRCTVATWSISLALCAMAWSGALAQGSPKPASPAPGGSRPAASAPPASTAPATSARPPSASAQGGIYSRPGRCRDQAIRMSLRGLARQRFIKRCRIARRSMPRQLPTGPATPSAPAKP